MTTQEKTTADPLADFQEGQWWVNELDAMAQAANATPDQKRAVAVVHHMLRASAAAVAHIDDVEAKNGRLLEMLCEQQVEIERLDAVVISVVRKATPDA